MSSKRQQTMAKMARERSVREKRERKAEKKAAKKLAGAEGGAVLYDEDGMPVGGFLTYDENGFPIESSAPPEEGEPVEDDAPLVPPAA